MMLVVAIAAIGTFVVVLIMLFRSMRKNGGAEEYLRKELREGRMEALQAAQGQRQELSVQLAEGNEELRKALTAFNEFQMTQVEGQNKHIKRLTESISADLDRIRKTMDSKVAELQKSNEKKLDEMRKTVDEKLHETLEKRLGESFKQVSERLEAVHKGLGEMQSLATGVGDLKRVLTNVKARGTWAEVNLGAILEQILTPAQFQRNVKVSPDSNAIVEFAVKLPGSQDDPDSAVWLPIDSKFPQEDYMRLQDAAEAGDSEAVQAAADALARTVRASAKDIASKYVSPPHTTDFAILFLATEGLFAEILRRPGLSDELRQNHGVIIAGPTTISSILSSLRMGFQTLAIEQRSAEVWKILAAVKTEFGKFGEVLAKVKRQLQTASNTIDKTGVRTRAMERKLRSVEQLPGSESSVLLGLPNQDFEEADFALNSANEDDLDEEQE